MKALSPRGAPRGFALIDAMVAIILFSIGILGMVVLQGKAVTMVADAKYRSDASMLAGELIAQMWASDPAQLATKFASPSGASYLVWKSKVGATLPGADATVSVGADSLVRVVVSWKGPTQAPSEAAHSYESITQLTR